MATVPSIDNQIPLLRIENDKPLSLEDEGTTPFGQWLAQKSEIDNSPRPIQFRQRDEDEHEQASAHQKETRPLTGEAAGTKTSKSLFKEEQNSAPKADQGNHALKQEQGAPLKNGTKSDIEKTNSARANNAKTQGAKNNGIPGAQTQANNTSASATTSNAGNSVGASAIATSAGSALSAIKGDKPTNGKSTSIGTQQRNVVKATPQHRLTVTKPTISLPTNSASLAALKTNVKAIFNSLKPLKTSGTTDTSTHRLKLQTGDPAKGAPLDQVKPIRLTTSPVINVPKQAGKTTVDHLKARKSAKLDAKTAIKAGKDEASNPDVAELTKTQNKDQENVKVKGKTAAKDGNKAGDILGNATKEGKISKKAKARRQSTLAKIKALKKNANQPVYPAENVQASIKEVESKNSQSVQATAGPAGQLDASQTDASSAESNTQSSLGKGESGLNTSASKSAVKTAQAFASRANSWIKALSERTAHLNKQNPNWKTLEMKLDRGDGNMTIKVMREDDGVTVSVQFTDDTLWAHAETQTNQILESLKEHYGKDVTFSFADKKEPAFDNPGKKSNRRQRWIAKTESAEKTLPAQPYNPLAPEQHTWIG